MSLRILTILTVTCLLCFAATASGAANEKVAVTVGQSITRTIDTTINTVSVADANIADVVVAGPRQILINGKAIGLTTLVVWNEQSESRVFDIVVRGPFSDQKIELRVKLAEINRSRMSELGMDFLFQQDGATQWTGGTFGGPVSTPSIPLSIFGGQPTEGASGVLSWMSGGKSLSAMVHAMQSDGVIHVLAEPNVVAASGEQADFLSGGEIPVPVASSGTTGGSTVTIEWKEFGVQVEFLPTIVDEGVINLNLSTEVSSLDFGNGIEISGFRIPALRSRKGSTTVELMDQETLVIGGLMMEEENNVRTRIPVLGHIPLLGSLFSSTKKVKTTTELMLVVSPVITRALPPGADVQLPSMEKYGTYGDLDLGAASAPQTQTTVSGAQPASSGASTPTERAASEPARRYDPIGSGH